MRTAAEVQQEQNNREWQRQQDDALQHIYRKYPSLKPGIAIAKAIVEKVSEFFGVQPGEMVVNLADFETAYSENRGEYNRDIFKYATETPEVQRQSVVDDIVKLLGPDSFQAERGRLRGMSLEALKARRDQIRLKQQLQPYTAKEIAEGLKIARSVGREPLPESWTAAKLRDASSHCLKFLNQKFGPDAVNARLQGRG